MLSNKNLSSGLKSGIMNLTLNKQDYNKVSKFEKNFAFRKRIRDPRLGQISIIQNPHNKQLLAVVETQVNDKKEAGKLIINCRKRMQNQHPNILCLRDYSIKKHSELCSSFFIIKQFFDFPRSDLYKEFIQKEKTGDYFNDIELTNILYQQVNANAYLNQKGEYHGDIDLINIAYDPNKMETKLIDKSQDFINRRQILQKQSFKVQQNKGNIYQSPLMFENLKKKNMSFKIDPHKEDVYALGLILLQLGDGKSIHEIYNHSGQCINQDYYQRLLQRFHKNYYAQNPLLVETVQNMLIPDENQRPNFEQIQKNLPDYNEVQKWLQSNRTMKMNYLDPNQYKSVIDNNSIQQNISYNDIPYQNGYQDQPAVYDNNFSNFQVQNRQKQQQDVQQHNNQLNQSKSQKMIINVKNDLQTNLSSTTQQNQKSNFFMNQQQFQKPKQKTDFQSNQNMLTSQNNQYQDQPFTNQQQNFNLQQSYSNPYLNKSSSQNKVNSQLNQNTPQYTSGIEQQVQPQYTFNTQKQQDQPFFTLNNEQQQVKPQYTSNNQKYQDQPFFNLSHQQKDQPWSYNKNPVNIPFTQKNTNEQNFNKNPQIISSRTYIEPLNQQNKSYSNDQYISQRKTYQSPQLRISQRYTSPIHQTNQNNMLSIPYTQQNRVTVQNPQLNYSPSISYRPTTQLYQTPSTPNLILNQPQTIQYQRESNPRVSTYYIDNSKRTSSYDVLQPRRSTSQTQIIKTIQEPSIYRQTNNYYQNNIIPRESHFIKKIRTSRIIQSTPRQTQVLLSPQINQSRIIQNHELDNYLISEFNHQPRISQYSSTNRISSYNNTQNINGLKKIASYEDFRYVK